MTKDEYLITDPPLKALTVFAMPMILGSFFQQVYNMADSIIVGQFVGSSALAAVGACAALTNVFICIALGAGVGAGVLVSRNFGAQNYGKMKTIVSTSLISFLLLSIFLGIFGVCSAHWMMRTLQTPADIMEDAVLYLRIYFAGFPFLFWIFSIRLPPKRKGGAILKELILDIDFMMKYAPLFAKAAWTTLGIGATGIFLSFLAGLVISVIRYRKIPFLLPLSTAYVELSRNTPLLVQLFFLYFGLPKAGIHISGETCAAVGLTFLGGSYMAEALRSGIESVSVSQYESAAALGLTEHQIFRFVLLPQAFTVSLPPLCANVLFLIKETSVFSVCAVPDLMYIAKDLIGLYYKTDETLWMLVISYLIILLPISAGASLLERRLRHGSYRDTDPV